MATRSWRLHPVSLLTPAESKLLLPQTLCTLLEDAESALVWPGLGHKTSAELITMSRGSRILTTPAAKGQSWLPLNSTHRDWGKGDSLMEKPKEVSGGWVGRAAAVQAESEASCPLQLKRDSDPTFTVSVADGSQTIVTTLSHCGEEGRTPGARGRP